MSFRATCAFCLLALGLLTWAVIVQLDGLIVPAAVVGMAIGLVLTMRLVLQGEFYTALFFGSHEAMFLFTLYAYYNAENVLQVPEFNFSVFTDENLRTAMIACLLTLGTIAATCLFLGKPSYRGATLAIRNLFEMALGKIASLRNDHIFGLVIVSFLSATALFIFGTSVLEVPYPFNNTYLWYPLDLLKFPAILALVALASIHARMVSPQHSHLTPLPLIYLTRLNFVVSTLLSLLILGSRGYFVFMFGVAGLFEFYSARKRRVIPVCGIIFVVLSYFLFTAWPYLRVQLSSDDAFAAVRTSIEIALGFGEEGSFRVSDELIDVGSFPLIGQSLFHLLYVIQLEAQGNSLAGSTFVNLIPQALPSFLDGVLWDRPLNDNWKLADCYVHGGGFLAIANAYWNGGMIVMALFVACLSAAFWYLDRHMLDPRSGTIFKVLYLAVFPVIAVQLFYGIQGLAKPIEVLGVLIIVDKVRHAKKTGVAGKIRSVGSVE